MALIGLGIGMMMQNLVLAVQNQVTPDDLGAASSWSRSSARSAARSVSRRSARSSATASPTTSRTASPRLASRRRSSAAAAPLPDVHTLPAPVRTVVESAYGHGIGDVFLFAAPFALLALIAAVHQGGAAAPATTTPTPPTVARESTVAAGGGAAVARTGTAGLTDERLVERERVRPAGTARCRSSGARTGPGWCWSAWTAAAPRCAPPRTRPGWPAGRAPGWWWSSSAHRPRYAALIAGVVAGAVAADPRRARRRAARRSAGAGPRNWACR